MKLTARRDNEQLKVFIKDHETEIAEFEKKIAAEKSKPQKACCTLV